MRIMIKTSFFATALVLAGCAALNMGWYKPGVSVEEFNQDKFDCMNGSQMQVTTSNMNGRGPTYYGNSNVTCNTFGSTTNCSGGGGYFQPGQVSGSSASYVTTNMPLFQACMQARGYVWTSQAQVENYEASQAPAEQASSEPAESSDDTASDSEDNPPDSDACKKMDALNKAFAVGTVTRQQFDAQFLPLMKACDGTPEEAPSAEKAPSDSTATDSEDNLSQSDACKKMDVLNKAFAAGIVTTQQFNAQFLPLMKACDYGHP